MLEGVTNWEDHWGDGRKSSCVGVWCCACRWLLLPEKMKRADVSVALHRSSSGLLPPADRRFLVVWHPNSKHNRQDKWPPESLLQDQVSLPVRDVVCGGSYWMPSVSMCFPPISSLSLLACNGLTALVKRPWLSGICNLRWWLGLVLPQFCIH